jgi:hypothetical protein
MAGDALPSGSVVDDFLDEMLPESVDWRHLVDKYPLACVAAAAFAGFWLARTKREMILAAAGSYLAASVGEAVEEIGERAGERSAAGARIGGAH